MKFLHSLNRFSYDVLFKGKVDMVVLGASIGGTITGVARKD